MSNHIRFTIFLIIVAVGCSPENPSKFSWEGSQFIIEGVEGNTISIKDNAAKGFIAEIESREIINSSTLWFRVDEEPSCWMASKISTDSLSSIEVDDLALDGNFSDSIFDMQECGYYVSVGNSKENMIRYLKYLDASRNASTRQDSLDAYMKYLWNDWPLDFYLIFNTSRDSILLISEQQ